MVLRCDLLGGPAGEQAAEFRDLDGVVDGADLGRLLTFWG
jgi:hypothetical protein